MIPQGGKCLIPTVWCGGDDARTYPFKDPQNNVVYKRKGTNHECLKKGIGVGYQKAISKDLHPDSIIGIKYIGVTYLESFSKRGLKTKKDLINYAKKSTRKTLTSLLVSVLTKSNGELDKKAYNSVIVFLIDNKVPNSKIPQCHKIMFE